MAQIYRLNRPDEDAVRRLLALHPDDAAGVIVRLAWQAGLLREELMELDWADVGAREGTLRLPGRTVPVCGELADFLAGLRVRTGGSGRVLRSDRDGRPLTPQSVSRLARGALDAVGQNSVRLIDLRHDFVIRQLRTHDWQYVSRVCGIDAAAMNLHFGAYLPEKRVSTRAKGGAQVDELRLWKLLQDEKRPATALTLSLTWQLGLGLEEIASLTWGQISAEDNTLRLADRTVQLPPNTRRLLAILAGGGRPDGGRVLLSPRAGRPFDKTHLSKMTRAALISAGLDDLTLRDLQMDYAVRVVGERAILDYLRAHGTIRRSETAALLNVSASTAYQRLLDMLRAGKLVRVGTRYYPAGATVPPERQSEVIVRYLTSAGFAYRQDIARLLHVEARQCYPILKKLVSVGTLRLEKQRYSLRGA